MQSIQRYAPVFEGMLRDAASSGAVGPFVGGGANWTHGDALTAGAASIIISPRPRMPPPQLFAFCVPPDVMQPSACSEPRLSGGCFCVGAEAVQGYAEVLGEAWLQSFPLLAAHRKRMVALPGAHPAIPPLCPQQALVALSTGCL